MGRGRGRSGGRGGSWSREKSSGGGRGRRSASGFDPLACYRCGVRGHLARDCPSVGGPSTSGSSTGPTRGSSSKSVQSGPRRGRGRGRQVLFGGLNVMYNEEVNEYPIDDYGQLYVPLGFEQTVAEETQEEKSKETKN